MFSYALILLLFITSVTIPVYLHRHRDHIRRSVWKVWVAPSIAIVGLAIALVFTTMYFDILVGGSQSMAAATFRSGVRPLRPGRRADHAVPPSPTRSACAHRSTGVTLCDWTAKGPVPLARAPAVRLRNHYFRIGQTSSTRITAGSTRRPRRPLRPNRRPRRPQQEPAA